VAAISVAAAPVAIHLCANFKFNFFLSMHFDVPYFEVDVNAFPISKNQIPSWTFRNTDIGQSTVGALR
jgi:hypothetical protein